VVTGHHLHRAWYDLRFLELSLFTGFLVIEQRQQLFYGPLSGTIRMSQYQEKHSPTNTCHRHQIFFYQLPRSAVIYAHPPCLIYVLDSPFSQSLSFLVCLWVWNLHFILHTYFHPIFLVMLIYNNYIIISYATSVSNSRRPKCCLDVDLMRFPASDPHKISVLRVLNGLLVDEDRFSVVVYFELSKTFGDGIISRK